MLGARSVASRRRCNDDLLPVADSQSSSSLCSPGHTARDLAKASASLNRISAYLFFWGRGQICARNSVGVADRSGSKSEMTDEDQDFRSLEEQRR